MSSTFSHGTNPPCDVCGVETLKHSDHSGGWNKCPACGWLQNIRRTPGGEPGFLDSVPLSSDGQVEPLDGSREVPDGS